MVFEWFLVDKTLKTLPFKRIREKKASLSRAELSLKREQG